jgi:hypothetical protein
LLSISLPCLQNELLKGGKKKEKKRKEKKRKEKKTKIVL